jgi:hypothetical protein
MTLFFLYPRFLHVLKWGLLFDERRDLAALSLRVKCPVQSLKLLLVFSSRAILGS